MKYKIRITESQLEELRKRYNLSNKKDTNSHGRNHGDKDPYIKKGFLFIKLDSNKNVPKDCHYLTAEDASELNQMGQDLESLKASYESKLKSLTGEKSESK